MSSDAKAWQEDDSPWWTAIHDGNCSAIRHTSLSLVELLTETEACYGHELFWEIRSYPSKQLGLVAYSYPRR